MNVIKLCGGLGNQMFQYAFGKAMNGGDYYDISWYSITHVPARPFVLHKFNTIIRTSNLFAEQPTVHEGVFDRDLTSKDGCNFIGYWQYLAYFKHIIPKLKSELQLKNEFKTPQFRYWLQGVHSGPSISVHVRRGDYLTKSKTPFEVQPVEYYTKAIEYLTSVDVIGNIFVFTDDVGWCKKNLPPTWKYPQLSECEDWELMRNCEYNVIVNSSFSYWAALMNVHESKIVIAPNRFLVRPVDEHGYNNKIHYPENWVTI